MRRLLPNPSPQTLTLTLPLTLPLPLPLPPRCADFFLDHGQYDKAVRLFTQAGDCAKALELCVLHNITLTEELAENCVPPLGAPGAEEG